MKYIIVFCLWLLLIIPTLAQDNILDDLLSDYVNEDDPSVVVYVRYGEESLVAVRGLSGLENNTRAHTDDLYRIGSVTKPFVATIMLQLVEEGVLALDDPMIDYLPDCCLNIDNADTATIRQLLQMTSGIFSYTDSEQFEAAVSNDPSYNWTASETVSFVAFEPAYFPTGEGYYYSNTNYNLAQMIIEAVTGNSLADELQTRIFEPLEMESCYLETLDVFAQNIVRGYSLYDNFEDVTDINDGVGLGDGGIVCTAEDLAKFADGLFYELLEDETLEQMLDTVDDGDGGRYGLGIGYDETEFGMMVGHDGATSGFQSTLQYLPDEDLVVVVLTNNFDSEIVADLAYDAFWLALDS